jgi:Rieske Fe-S protein
MAKGRDPSALGTTWREQFPIEWDEDHYVTRRELAKFLTLGSALLCGASTTLAVLGKTAKPPVYPRVRIGTVTEIALGATLLFRYPTDGDACLLVRTDDGKLLAYSQVCTHLSCAVIHRPKTDHLFCPCHQGYFSLEDGRPTAGPPTRRLPRIALALEGDDIYAVGVEV